MRRWLAAVVILSVVAAGCSRGDKASQSPSTVADEKPRNGGTLRIGSTRLTTLDPAQARSVEELMVADHLFDGLTAYDTKTLAPVSSLAVRWQTTPDQKVWDFILNPAAKFSNGRRIEAKDVKYSLERIAVKGSGSPGAELLAPVEGYAAVAQGSTGDLSGVVAPSPDIVHITLTEPWSDLPVALASPQFGIVPREAVEAAAPAPAFGAAPSATSGTFSFKARSGEVVTAVKAPGSRARLAELQIREFPDVSAAYAAFRKGDLDWVRVPPEEVDAAGQSYGRSHFNAYVAELFYGFNMKSPKFADVRFREAIVRAVDRQAIATAVYGGTVDPLKGVVVAGVPGGLADACGERCRYDVATAKKLIGDVFGAAAPPEVQINYDQDPTQEKVAKAVEAGLKAVNIPTKLVGKPAGEYGDFVVSGQQELFRLGWIAAYPSPDAFITPLFRTGSRDNLMGLSFAGLDSLIAAARAEPEGAKKADWWKQAQQAVMQQLPVVPLAQFKLYSVTSARVRGLDLTLMGSFDASTVWLGGPPR